LAQRGWQVTVLDQGAEPAAGASGLPVGLVAPHVSADDRALSRLSRSGVRTTLRRAQTLLQAGLDWQLSGVLEHRVKDSRDLPPDWLVPDSPGQHWSRPASAAELNAAGLAADCPAHWHAQAGWVRPAALVRAMLAQVGITWCGQRRVARLLRSTAGWHLLDGQGQELAQAELVVLAAGYDTLALLQELEPAAQASSPQALPLNPLRGQITWGLMPPDADTTAPLPPFPVNGLGSFISGLATPEGRAWYVGSSFERGCALAVVRPQDNLSNLEKLQTLLPLTAARLQAQGQTQHLRSWTAVRCTVPDRVPVVGPWDVARHPGLWLCTAMGARGLTLATLCGELLAAQLHGEPLPLPLKQVRALAPQRWQNGAS
jgi:tRNA 5-methylaminomethyl-2-thiouridine biosynthesis bifunctional protein